MIPYWRNKRVLFMCQWWWMMILRNTRVAAIRKLSANSVEGYYQSYPRKWPKTSSKIRRSRFQFTHSRCLSPPKQVTLQTNSDTSERNIWIKLSSKLPRESRRLSNRESHPLSNNNRSSQNQAISLSSLTKWSTSPWRRMLLLINLWR